MQLLLTITNIKKFSASDRASFVIVSQASIGRSETADWQLPDSSRFLSSIHCIIIKKGEKFFITDKSRNGILINRQPMLSTHYGPLENEDLITIGPYEIFVRESVSSDDISSSRHSIDNERTLLKSKSPMVNTYVTHNKPQYPLSQMSQKLEQFESNKKTSFTSFHNEQDFIALLCNHTALKNDDLTNYSNSELLEEIPYSLIETAKGITHFQQSIARLRHLVKSKEKISDDKDVLKMLFSKSEDMTTSEKLSNIFDDFIRHDEAVFHAMQIALFRLLNEFSTTEIEQHSREGFLQNKKKQNWDIYVKKWEDVNIKNENGILDVFLNYFRDAYDEKIKY